MANLEPSRSTRNASTMRGKLRKKNGEHVRTPDAYFAEIQKTGWTPQIEADLFATPSQLQIQPELMESLIKDAGQRRDAKLWRLLACVSESKSEDRYAATCATAALQLEPADVTAMGVLARLCEKHQAEQEAADWHRRILAVDPMQLGSLRFLAHLHYQRGEYEPALLYWNQLIEAEPKVRTNKLYWLLNTVKSTGIHGLAQPLTDVRRWRTFTQEETQLAHELFLLVAKLCLQTRQRARAKQYLTRAMQLTPTPEVEALLAEVSDRPLTTATPAPGMTRVITPVPTLPVKAPVAIPHPSGPIRLKYPVVPHPPLVLPEGAWNGRPRVMAVLTSGVGVIALMLFFAVVMIWSLPDDPNPSAALSPREKRVLAPGASVASSSPKQEVASLNQKPFVPPTSPTVVSPPSPAVPTPAPIVVPAQPEAKKIETLTSAQKNLTQTPAPVPTPKPDMPPRPSMTQPVPPKPATDSVTPERVTAPPPSPTPSTPIQKVIEKPLSPAPVAVAKENASSVPPGNLNVHSSPSFFAPTNGERTTSPLSQSTSNTEVPSPIVAPPASAAVEKPKPLTPTAPQPAVTKAPARARTDTSLSEETLTAKAVEAREEKNVPPIVSLDPKPNEATEPHPAEQGVVAKSDPEISHSATTDAEPREVTKTIPAREESEHNTITSAVDLGRPPSSTSSEDTQNSESADTHTEEGERTAAVENNSTARQTEEAAIRSVRPSSRLPHASRFPVRERLVSVPPEKLILKMSELMKQEIDATTVRKISPGVIRARVSGKPRNPARPPKEYGQYLVEIVPGPTAGTSRVRTQVLLFDWRTGDPIVDADARADRLLKKIPN